MIEKMTAKDARDMMEKLAKQANAATHGGTYD